jgi:transcriptional regulator with XRE-family HTH domain
MRQKTSKKEYKMNVGENIRKWRELKGFQQKELADKLDISITALSNIETGISKPNTERLEDIADALEIEVNQLFVNPQQLFTFNNSPNSNGVYGTQHQHNNIDKSLYERMLSLMEKMTDYFTNKNKSVN